MSLEFHCALNTAHKLADRKTRITGSNTFSIKSFILKKYKRIDPQLYCKQCDRYTKNNFIPSITDIKSMCKTDTSWKIPYLHASLRKDSQYRTIFYHYIKNKIKKIKLSIKNWNIDDESISSYLFFITLIKKCLISNEVIISVLELYNNTLIAKNCSKVVSILLVNFYSKMYGKSSIEVPHPIDVANALGVSLNKYFVFIKPKILCEYFAKNSEKLDEFVPKNAYPNKEYTKYKTTDYCEDRADISYIIEKFNYKCFNLYDIFSDKLVSNSSLPVSLLSKLYILHDRKFHMYSFNYNMSMQNIQTFDQRTLMVKWQFAESDDIKKIYKSRIIGSPYEKNFLRNMIFHTKEFCSGKSNIKDIIEFLNNPDRICKITSTNIAMLLNNIYLYRATSQEDYEDIGRALYFLVSLCENYKLEKVLQCVKSFNNCHKYSNEYKRINLNEYTKETILSASLCCTVDIDSKQRYKDEMNKDIVETLIAFYDKTVDYELARELYELGFCIPELGRFGLSYGDKIIRIIGQSDKSLMWEYLKNINLTNVERLLYIAPQFGSSWFSHYTSLLENTDNMVHGFIINSLIKSSCNDIFIKRVLIYNGHHKKVLRLKIANFKSMKIYKVRFIITKFTTINEPNYIFTINEQDF